MNSKLKMTALIFVGFVTLYILVGVWISKDTYLIMASAMNNTTAYESYMNKNVYEKMNPKVRNMPNYDAQYTVENHHYGTPIPLHFFGVARVSTHHTFDNQSMGFHERVVLKLKLIKGKWYATDVSIQP